MKKWLWGFGIGIVITSCSGGNNKMNESVGFDNQQYKGQYYGNRPKDDLNNSASNKPYVNGSYGWQRNY
jgi:hypothetical protein